MVSLLLRWFLRPVTIETHKMLVGTALASTISYSLNRKESRPMTGAYSSPSPLWGEGKSVFPLTFLLSPRGRGNSFSYLSRLWTVTPHLAIFPPLPTGERVRVRGLHDNSRTRFSPSPFSSPRGGEEICSHNFAKLQGTKGRSLPSLAPPFAVELEPGLHFTNTIFLVSRNWPTLIRQT